MLLPGKKIDLPDDRHVALLPYDDGSWMLEFRTGKTFTRTRISDEAKNALECLMLGTDTSILRYEFTTVDGDPVWRLVSSK